MKIRLTGTRAECEVLAAVLTERGRAVGIGVVREVSGFYANRPPDGRGRVYLDLDPDPAPCPRPPGGPTDSEGRVGVPGPSPGPGPG